MDLWYFIMELVMLLGGAFFLGALAQRFRQSAIVGYLLAGAIVGPLLFNAEIVNQSAELGVSLLLFSIGLEFSLNKLKSMGKLAFGGGTTQVLGTMGLVAGVLYFKTGMAQAVTVGAIVALSSTAVVIRILVDRSEIDSIRGRACLGFLLLQDIAIVPLVMMVSFISPTAAGVNFGFHLLKIFIAVVGLAVVYYLLLYHAIPFLLSSRALFADRELTVLLVFSVGIGAAWSAHAVGVSPALGAFVAGMLLGESPYATQIRADIGALRTIMVTLFFTSIGMLAKPMWLLLNLPWVLLVAGGIFILKVGITFSACRLFGLPTRQALGTGFSLGQIGEFSFVLAAAALNGGIFDTAAFNLIVSVIIVLMFAAPYMVGHAEQLADRMLALIVKKPSLREESGTQIDSPPTNRVLVIGLGPAGLQVVKGLLAHQMTPVVIDVNPQSRGVAKTLGVDLNLGDAGHEEVLTHADLRDICMAVVTVPDPKTAIRIIGLLRQLKPSLAIIARCRFNRYKLDLTTAGADVVVDEEFSIGDQLIAAITGQRGEDSDLAFACRLVGKVES